MDRSGLWCNQKTRRRPKPGMAASQRITPPSAGGDTLRMKAGVNFERIAFSEGTNDLDALAGHYPRKRAET
jgi:hypothetical protein